MRTTTSVAVGIVATASVAILATSANHLRGMQEPAFTAVVGNWQQVDDGGPAFKVDGSTWSGTTERPKLEGLSKVLFAAPASETFIANTTAPAAFPLAVLNGLTNFTQGTLRVQFKLVGGASDQIAGIAFDIKPNGEYFFARYNTKDGNLAVWRYRNGARERLIDGEQHLQLALGTWHDLVVTIAGDQLTATLDGNALKLETTLPEPVAGRVGLWAKRDAISVFRDFRVTTPR
jgi:hypothetical protein